MSDLIPIIALSPAALTLPLTQDVASCQLPVPPPHQTVVVGGGDAGADAVVADARPLNANRSTPTTGGGRERDGATIALELADTGGEIS